MDVIGRKLESQVQFWSLLGPFLVLLSFTVLLFKVSEHWYFPVSALIGIPLCVKWKMKGLAAALGCLFLLTGIGYHHLELDDRYWHVGLAMTMAFSFIVLTLSLEEAQGLINQLQLESQSRLNNFSLLDEKWKSAEQEWFSEKEKLKIEIHALVQEGAKTQEGKQTFYKLAQLAKDELVQVREQHDQLLQELIYKKQQISQLYERLDETEMTIQEFVNSDAEKQIGSLRESLKELEHEHDTLKAKVDAIQTEKQSLQQENEELWQEVGAVQEREKCSLEEFQQEKEKHLQAYEDLKNNYLLLKEEKNLVEQQQRSFELKMRQQMQQMGDLKAEHRQSIEESRHSFIHLEAKLTAEEQEKKALHLQKEELELSLQQAQEQLHLAKQKVKDSRQHQEKLPYALGNTRQIEAMYIQLKHQFEEKCDVLDATRRELFHVHEKLLKWQKEQEEERIVVSSANEQFLEHDFIELASQYEDMQKEYQQEIDELVQLIDHLMKRQNDSR